jgi:hypothetical protein
MLSRLYRYYWIGRALGWDNLPRRVWQETKLRLGVLRRRLPGGPAPAETLRAAFVSDYAPERSTHFWSQRAEQLGLGTQRVAALRTALRGCVDDATWDRTVGAEVRDLAAGRFRMFSRQVVELGRPPKFNFDGFHGVEWPTGLHWTEYSPAKLKLPELKLVWEASRFSWAYALARHHVRTGAAEPAQLFWEYLRSWDAQNPYGLTTQWSCGQESSFRCFAWVFAACATMGAGGAAAADLHRLTELVWYTGRHVRENINYARSQKNNHAISEAVCLLMIGRLFPELSAARGWERAGAKILAEEVERQVYADGSFVQHSTNYHRVMLDDLSWAASVMRATGGTLPERVQRKFRLAAEWLAAFTDRETGDVPNYGPNDGALILPLSCCDYRDYRPAVQAASVLAGDGRVFDGGPWDEALMWLGGREEAALRGRGGATTLPRAPSEFPEGGYYCFRGPASFGFVRCHTYRDRPTQADMLHFDLTYRGVNVLRDAGSYAYNTKPPWQQWFPGTAAHNTITVDDQDQMEKGPRFLWLRWTRAGVRAWERASDGSAELFRGEHYGYRRLQAPATHVRHRRRSDWRRRPGTARGAAMAAVSGRMAVRGGAAGDVRGVGA